MSRYLSKIDGAGDRADYGNSPTGRLLSVGREGVGWRHTLIDESDRLPFAAAILDIDVEQLKAMLRA